MNFIHEFVEDLFDEKWAEKCMLLLEDDFNRNDTKAIARNKKLFEDNEFGEFFAIGFIVSMGTIVKAHFGYKNENEWAIRKAELIINNENLEEYGKKFPINKTLKYFNKATQFSANIYKVHPFIQNRMLQFFIEILASYDEDFKKYI